MLYFLSDEVKAIKEQGEQNASDREKIAEQIKATRISTKGPYSGYAEIERLSTQAERAEIAGYVLNNDLKRAIYNRIIPVVAEVYGKYAGKQLGPKTIKKLRDELKQRTGCYIYHDERYNSTGFYFKAQPMNEKGFTDWRYPEVHFAYCCPSGEYSMIGNTLQPLRLECFSVMDCRKSEADAATIADAAHKVKEAVAALNWLINQYNAVIPSGMEYLSSVYVRL